MVPRSVEIVEHTADVGIIARGETVDHLLFSGPPGLGKTSLALILAGEMGVEITITSGPVLERKGDLAAILTALGPGDVLFVDAGLHIMGL